MKQNERWLLAIAVLLVDVVTIGIPLTAIFAAYILITRPPWFRDWALKLYQDEPRD